MNALILRLKNSIDSKILESIDKKLMGQLLFVPISVKDNFLFVAVSNRSNKDEISNILKSQFNYPVKFMLVADDDLRDLLMAFLPISMVPSPVENKPEAPKAVQAGANSSNPTPEGSGNKLGEMLVAKGILTDVQLMKALSESKKKRIPIGSMLFEMGIITLDQLKSVLHDQTGYDLVTSDQLVSQKKFVNILQTLYIRKIII